MKKLTRKKKVEPYELFVLVHKSAGRESYYTKATLYSSPPSPDSFNNFVRDICKDWAQKLRLPRRPGLYKVNFEKVAEEKKLEKKKPNRRS